MVFLIASRKVLVEGYEILVRDSRRGEIACCDGSSRRHRVFMNDFLGVLGKGIAFVVVCGLKKLPQN